MHLSRTRLIFMDSVSTRIHVFNHIRGLSRKYRAYLYIAALTLSFIIGRVASFKVIPTWLNSTVPAMFPLLETVLELTFRHGLEYARRIIFNRRFVIESLSFEWFFEFGNSQKSQGAMSGLYGGCRSNAILCLLRNCCTRFDEPHIRESFHEQLIDDRLQSQVAPAQYYPMFLSSKVG